MENKLLCSDVFRLGVKIVVEPGVELPEYATEGSAGMDLRSKLDVVVRPHERALIGTGLYVAVPVGWELQVRPRSGLALKHGITVLNSPGTVDSDYRGEVGVVLYNSSEVPFTVKKGDHIAQGVLSQVAHCRWEPVEELDDTTRGTGGFGSTGV